jgi:transposase
MRMLARIMGIGIETADMLVHEVLSRKLRDQRGVARYGSLTGSPDESGSKRRERGLARAGNARVRRGSRPRTPRAHPFREEARAVDERDPQRTPTRGPTPHRNIFARSLAEQ